MVLSVVEIGKAFAGRPVLQDISFALQQGEKALLLGPSGSGKSTLLNIICGLQRPDHGTVTVSDEVIVSADRRAVADDVRKRAMGIVFQTLRLVSALSVRGNLELAQRLQTGVRDHQAIEHALDRLGILDRADARPFELSQGEAQRAAIARAIVVKPKLLIADEPTSALDHANTDKVARLLLDIADSIGAALLIATHDDRLRPSFPRTLELRDGKIT